MFQKTVRSIAAVGFAVGLAITAAAPSLAEEPADGCVARNGEVRGIVYLYSSCGSSRTVIPFWNCQGNTKVGTWITIYNGQSKSQKAPNVYCWFTGLYQK